MSTLKGKLAVISGASSGLGEAVAKKIAAQGCFVILVSENESGLDRVKEDITLHHGKAEYYVCDLRSLDQIKQSVAQILNKHPRIDILINNAGVWTDEELEAKRPELRQQALEVNVLGNINLTKALLPLMIKQKGGHILNVVSTSGVNGIPEGDNSKWQTYGASKWAMAGFTQSLRESLNGKKIKVSGFFPGGFESNLYEKAGRKNPHKQPWMMRTDDVADALVFALTQPDDVLVQSMVITKF